jgi:hypothetical protein
VEANCRRIVILNLHDITYPLMRKIRTLQPQARFTTVWDAADMPDAMVVLRMGLDLPLYQKIRTGARWRLVGQGPGEGVYLPESRVSELGWWERLPDFAGWTPARGLPVIELRADDSTSLFGRELGEGGADLFYEGRGEPMRISMSLTPFEVSSGEGLVYLQTDEGEISKIEVRRGGVTAVANMILPSSPGRHRLRLWQAPGAKPLLVLSLVINDSPPVQLSTVLPPE